LRKIWEIFDPEENDPFVRQFQTNVVDFNPWKIMPLFRLIAGCENVGVAENERNDINREA